MVPAIRDLAFLPKTDLHVHLEGSIRVATLAGLAARHGASLPPGLRDGRYSFSSFVDFVSQYGFACACLQDAADFRRVAYEFCEDEAASGVRYAEVTFTVASHALRFGGDWDMPVASVLEGLADGERDFGMRARLVLDHVRGFPVELAEQTVDAGLRFAGDGVVAMGLGGNEIHPPEPFAAPFRRAVDHGLHSVPHAGEAAGAASIQGALDALAAERLGHGIRVLDDSALTARVRDAAIPLEVCPSSNVATGIVPSWARHPLPRLLEAGLVVTLNSDDPAMFHSPLLGEYEAARSVFGLDDAALAAIARNGVRASFLPAGDKASLEAAIDGWLDSPPASETSEGRDRSRGL